MQTISNNMYLSELCNFNKVKENLLRMVLLIIISLSNRSSGLTSHITMVDTEQNAEISKNVRISSDSDFTNASRIQISPTPWSTTEHFLKEKYFVHINHSPIREQERKVEVNKFVSKSTKNHLSNLRVAHSLVDLINRNAKTNSEQNTSKDDEIFSRRMYFGTANSTVIATQIGATAHIPCIVHHIGECVISWIRKKDYHLLTVGLTTYSSDQRFSATHLKHSEDWTLQIKFVQQRDAGIYECQVSTHPPTSIFLHLLVVEARAEISGPSIRYLTPGSTLRLQCHVVQNTENSEYIFWYHDNRMINYDADRGINVSTEPDFQSSELIISRTSREHSGNYTCVASNTQPASVLIHIFKGDNPAAMYHGHVGSSTKSYQTHLLHILITLVAMIYRTYVKRKII